jgi:hypothetical protein
MYAVYVSFVVASAKGMMYAKDDTVARLLIAAVSSRFPQVGALTLGMESENALKHQIIVRA